MMSNATKVSIWRMSAPGEVGTKARQLSRAERRAMVEHMNPVLPISQQCRLLAVPRSSVYRKLAKVSAEDLAIMALIDRQYLGPITARAEWRHGWRLRAKSSTVRRGQFTGGPVYMGTIGVAAQRRFPRQLAKRGNARLRPHPHRHHQPWS